MKTNSVCHSYSIILSLIVKFQLHQLQSTFCDGIIAFEPNKVSSDRISINKSRSFVIHIFDNFCPEWAIHGVVSRPGVNSVIPVPEHQEYLVKLSSLCESKSQELTGRSKGICDVISSAVWVEWIFCSISHYPCSLNSIFCVPWKEDCLTEQFCFIKTSGAWCACWFWADNWRTCCWPCRSTIWSAQALKTCWCSCARVCLLTRLLVQHVVVAEYNFIGSTILNLESQNTVVVVDCEEQLGFGELLSKLLA